MPNRSIALELLLWSTMWPKQRSAADASPPRRDCQSKTNKLTELEEEVIFRYISGLYLRIFASTYAAVRDMADKLLAARGGGQVGVQWPRNFVKRTESLTTRFNRAYDK
jgi:hypothetical protein